MSSVYATTFANLHLDSIPEGINENNIITFSGQLTTSNGTSIPHRTIFIQDDTSYTKPEIILAITETDDSGKFSTSWKVVPKENGHSYHFFANFLGGKTYGFTRSEAYESFVQISESSINQDQKQSKLPDWFKMGSKMWHNGQIRDVDFAHGIRNLIDNGIMQKPNQTSTTIWIPSWVKNNANWYADGQITEDEYLNSIQYLINTGIISA
ncbi:MAG TPA: hypothetical protein VFD60_02550 [Nitrososphaeraceae archaeon]|nr:hypothetical protein [Nitrososphaeraceae archaeon]